MCRQREPRVPRFAAGRSDWAPQPPGRQGCYPIVTDREAEGERGEVMPAPGLQRASARARVAMPAFQAPWPMLSPCQPLQSPLHALTANKMGQYFCLGNINPEPDSIVSSPCAGRESGPWDPAHGKSVAGSGAGPKMLDGL